MSIHSLHDGGMTSQSNGLVAALDEWRAAQRPLLSRAGAIHRLVATRRIPKKLRSNRLVAKIVSDGGSVTVTEQPVIAVGGVDPAWKTEQLPATVTKSN